MTSGQVTCIRRWFTTWSTCTCSRCVPDARRRRKLLEAGLVRRTPSDQAWVVFDEMRCRGWSPTAIASATGVPARCVHSIFTELRAGHRRVFGPTIAQLIVSHGQPTRGLISAVGSTRRVRALARLGWTNTAIAEAAGLALMTVSVVRSGNHPTTSPRTASGVDKAYRLLSGTPGPSTATRDAAERAGWAPPLAWDDDTIDDPEATPEGVREATRPGSRRNRKTVQRAEDAAVLAGQGETLDAAAIRLSTTPGALERSLYRAGGGDLVARLKHGDQAARSA